MPARGPRRSTTGGADGDLVNDVDLTADGAYDVNGDHKPDNVDTNACADAQTELVPGDLGIQISTAPTFVMGEPITWTIVVTNHTPACRTPFHSRS